MTQPTLRLKFHGRIIDHLGIQMYQSPTAAIAELVSNAWDADAETVEIDIPDSIEEAALIKIRDNGSGMTFQQCEERYLNVGYNRRGENSDSNTPKGRPVLGRKGIGKFAGFGIAELLEVDTVSEVTGERTVFELDVNKLREGGYVEDGGLVTVKLAEGPDEARKSQKGTCITLRRLTLGRVIPREQFTRSLRRRFLLAQWADNFTISVKGEPIGEGDDLQDVEYIFPRDYKADELPQGLRTEDTWGIETLSNGKDIRWRIQFMRNPIEDEELRGVSVFAKVKLAQRPFFFNLSGGLGGQHGQEYLSGQVQADYIDQLKQDIIATERQRINWEHRDAMPLEGWGQTRVKELLRIWKERRGEARQLELENKLSAFGSRLEKLRPHERKTIRRALAKLGSIPSLSKKQFAELSEAMLTAWEQGRLRELIEQLSDSVDLTAPMLVDLLSEADVLSALNLAEAIKTKIEAVKGLRKHIEDGTLENPLRDYIANHPYLLDPKWDTFQKEISVEKILNDSAKEAGLIDYAESEKQRIDLAMRSGRQLLVVEFMKPGRTLDWDHVSRCRKYINLVRAKVEANTALGIDPNQVTGLIVADKIATDTAVRAEVKELKKSEIYTAEWGTLLLEAQKKWTEFMEIIKERAPNDERITALGSAEPANSPDAVNGAEDGRVSD